MPHLKRTIDLAGWVALILLIVSAVWWCAVIDTRTKDIAPMKGDISIIKTDIAVIKAELNPQISQR